MSSLQQALVTAGLASGACLLAGRAFVTPVQAPASQDSLASQMAGSAPVVGTGNLRAGCPSTMAVLGVAGALAMAASTHRRKSGSLLARRAASDKNDQVDLEASTLKEWIQSGGSGFEANGFNPALQVGVTAPMGYFDPLGFCSDGKAETFRKLRTAEIKHGRVAMMASAGAVFQHYVKFPGFEKVPAGLGAVTEGPGSFGFAALFLVAGVLELAIWKEDDNKEPGNFGDPTNMSSVGEQYCSNALEMRNRELNNCRASMIAVVGIIVAELATGKDAIQQFGV